MAPGKSDLVLRERILSWSEAWDGTKSLGILYCCHHIEATQRPSEAAILVRIFFRRSSRLSQFVSDRSRVARGTSSPLSSTYFFCQTRLPLLGSRFGLVWF